MTINDPRGRVHDVRILAVDEAGNKGFPVLVTIA
jgi:hypothetical protein